MNKIAKSLTNYVIRKGMVDEVDKEIYEYGFVITVQMVCFVLFSLCVMLYLQMIVEGILFFIIFSPLRSYAGGLHLKKFVSCFILSCSTFWGILMIVKYIRIPVPTLFVVLLILEMSVFALYPIENVNRKVDEKENKYFRRKLEQFLIIDLIIALICIPLKSYEGILVITATFLIVVITMIIGKRRNLKSVDFE